MLIFVAFFVARMPRKKPPSKLAIRKTERDQDQNQLPQGQLFLSIKLLFQAQKNTNNETFIYKLQLHYIL